MINFKEMVLEAITADGSLHALTTTEYNNGLKDVFDAIVQKFPSFAAYIPEIQKPTFHSVVWNTVGVRPTVTMFANNELYQEIYPYLDFLCNIRDNASLKDRKWGTDAFTSGELAPVETSFIGNIPTGSPSDQPLFGYEPMSSSLRSIHKQIKDKILGAGVVGRKTLENCKKKQYTIRQAIYLAGQLRRSNQPIFSFVPAKNAQVDKFLLDAGNPDRVTKFLGGSVTPQTKPGIVGSVVDKLRTAKSALLNPSNIPPLLKGMEENTITLMDSVKMYADEKFPLVPPPLPEKQSESVDIQLNKILDLKIEDLINDASNKAKDVQIRLTTLLNHIPGEKDIVGKLKATSSALGNVQAALGIKM